MTKKEKEILQYDDVKNISIRNIAKLLKKELEKELKQENFIIKEEDFYFRGRGCKTEAVFYFKLNNQIIVYDLKSAIESLKQWYKNDLSLINTLKKYDENVREQYIKQHNQDSKFNYVKTSCSTFSNFINSIKTLYQQNYLSNYENDDYDEEMNI